MSCPNAAFFIAAQAGVSTIAWGGVGVAKNALIEAVIAFLGYVGHVFIPSQHAPEDIGGMPFHDAEHGRFKMIHVEWMDDLKQALRWLHVDELTSSGPHMRPPLLSCFNERRVGALRFHPSTIVTAAANPPELCPNGSPLEPALCNRMYHHDWVFPSELWHHGLRNGGVFPVPTEFPKVGDFSYLLPKYGGYVSRLTRAKPSLANVEKVHEGTRAFATPRSWWNLVRVLAAADSVGYLDECRGELATGTVGNGAGAELLALIDAHAIPNVPEIVAGTEKVDMSATNIDRLIGLPGSIVLHLQEAQRQGPVDPEHVENSYKVLVDLCENDLADFGVPALGEVKKLFPDHKVKPALGTRYFKIISALGGA